MKFTDLSIRQLPFAEGQERHYDDSLPNFGVTVGKRTKTFFVVAGPKRKLMTLGKYPDLGLSDARKEAKRLMVQLPEEHVAISLNAAVGRYLDDCKTRIRPRTLLEYRRYLGKHPKITLATLSRKNVDVSTSHSTMAWRVFANWCIRNELLEKNPFLHIPVSYGKRSRVLTNEEIAILMTYEDGRFSDALKLCLLTGQRKTEIASIRQAWFRNDTLTIPASFAKNKKEHVIAFNLYTAKYLPKIDQAPFNGFSKSKARFDKLHPLPHWTIHDLRRTFATIHARLGTPIHVVEAMLNHTSGTVSGVAAIYIRHNFLAEMRKAALAYELHIARLTRAS